LDDSRGNGTQGTVWYRRNDRNYYFDSYGIQPRHELKTYLDDPIVYNTENIQRKGEVFCGHLCLYVLKQLSLGRRFQEIINGLR